MCEKQVSGKNLESVRCKLGPGEHWLLNYTNTVIHKSWSQTHKCKLQQPKLGQNICKNKCIEDVGCIIQTQRRTWRRIKQIFHYLYVVETNLSSFDHSWTACMCIDFVTQLERKHENSRYLQEISNGWGERECLDIWYSKKHWRAPMVKVSSDACFK